MTKDDLIAALPPLAPGVKALLHTRENFEYEPGKTVNLTVAALYKRDAPEGYKAPSVYSTRGDLGEMVALLRESAKPYGFFA